MFTPSKVYAIRHVLTKRTYIGRTSDPERRYRAHINALRRGTHPVEDLQADFDTYGAHLVFAILDDIETYEELAKERKWMARFRSYDRRYGYNYKDVAAKPYNSRPDLTGGT